MAETLDERFAESWEDQRRQGGLRTTPRCPWTVSVAAMPGEAPCSELQRLDLALRKDRGPREGDELLERWKALIEWPVEPKLEPVTWFLRGPDDAFAEFRRQWDEVARFYEPWRVPVIAERRGR